MLKLLLTLLFVLTLQAKMVDAVAVIVEGEPITLYDITQEMQLAHVSKKEAIDILIRKKLEALEIKKRGISVSEDEVYDEIRRLAEANHMSISQFYDAVRESNGLSSSQLKEKIKERLLSQKLYQSVAMSKMSEPDEREIEEFFKLHKEEFVHPAFYDVIIYTAPNKDLLIQKLNNPMFYSNQIKQSKQRIAYEQLPPALAKLLDSTKEGGFTQIVPDGKGGYMTFYIEKRGPQGEADITKLRPLIVNAMMNQKRKEILDDYFANLFCLCRARSASRSSSRRCLGRYILHMRVSRYARLCRPERSIL